MRLIHLVIFVLALAPFATGAGAAETIRKAEKNLAVPYLVTARDRADVKRAEDYLNNVTTIESRFLQVTSLGEFSEGKLYMSRPGKMLVDYDAPNPILMVARNNTLIYVDRSFGQSNYYPLSETPLSILLADRIDLFSDAFTITGIEREAKTLRITLAKGSDAMAGQVTLVFSESPFQLKKWDIVDTQGLLTAVVLQDPRFGKALPAKIFDYQAPEPKN